MKALRFAFLCLIALAMTVGIGLNSYADTQDRSNKDENDFEADVLYVGDGDNSVKSFDVNTGHYLSTFVTPDSGGLDGPRGLIFVLGKLLVANQNVNQDFAGEILRYQRGTGAFIDALVPCNPLFSPPRTCDPNGPFAPRGIISGFLPTVYVADFGGVPGKVIQFDEITGKFIRNLDTTGFNKYFFPRGIVFGPDKLIYVSVTGNLAPLPGPPPVPADPLAAYILRFNPITGKFMNIVAQYNATAKDCSKDFHRPEGLVFGPDGNLYITSFRNNAGNITSDPQNVDSVLVFNRFTGKCINQIPFYNPSQSRTFAQAILFGPKGRLFTSMNNTGEIRRYDVKTKTYEIFINSGLMSPWYITFGKTDPRTLEYND